MDENTLPVKIFWESRLAQSNYYYRPNETKRLFVDLWRARVQNVVELCKDITPFSPHKRFLQYKHFTPQSAIKLYVTENAIGKIVYDLAAVPLRDVVYGKCNKDFSIIGTKTLLVLKAYKTDFGKLPASLNELVLRYLPRVPQDPFDGNPIRYSLEKKIIYSVGKDLKDSGGSEGTRWQEMDNPTFPIEF